WAEAMDEAAMEGRRLPGAGSRWNRGKDLSWEPVRPDLVCEVAYDHMQGTRFRHAAHFVRWRPDKLPKDCRYDQLEVAPAYELGRVCGSGRERREGDLPEGERLGEGSSSAASRNSAPLPARSRSRSQRSRSSRHGS